MATAEKLVELLIAQKLTCATAESCTGGGVGYSITAVPGSSAVFKGGIISYANEVKERQLGVPQEILSKFGAVSSECAAKMAENARNLLMSDLAVSVTGIAGPGGASAEKPVGLVWFGISTKDNTRTWKKLFSGDRETVRSLSVEYALQLLASAAAAK